MCLGGRYSGLHSEGNKLIIHISTSMIPMLERRHTCSGAQNINSTQYTVTIALSIRYRYAYNIRLTVDQAMCVHGGYGTLSRHYCTKASTAYYQQALPILCIVPAHRCTTTCVTGTSRGLLVDATCGDSTERDTPSFAPSWADGILHQRCILKVRASTSMCNEYSPIRPHPCKAPPAAN